jgi:hypothetical protein
MSIPYDCKSGGDHFVGRRTTLTSMPSSSIANCALSS